jgi:type II secretory ATPase GspE/PulE/Tfp pilus assembly ATPase PilB-like protein
MPETDIIGLLDLSHVKIDPIWAMRLPANLAIRRQVLPISAVNGSLVVACADPHDAAALEAVQRFTGRAVIARAADLDSLKRAISRVYSGPARASKGAGRIGSLDLQSASIDLEKIDSSSFTADLLHAAVLRQASDIHIDPGRETMRIRLRVDGVLEEFSSLPMKAFASVMSRFKVMSQMDIAEKRAPQDGGFTHRLGEDGHVDIRTATLPTKYGERMTLRLLSLQTESLTLENLGMSGRDLQTTATILDRPHGLILVTGPTGSGKTTTLYSLIRQLIGREALNIITIEDPIEYEIGGASQVEIETGDRVSFSKALRSALRHDPDVLMIGEVRDRETIDVAVKASLTGHLVLSTLHTNSAASVITRLRDMGVEPYLVAATLRMCVAQRLVRRLCMHPGCRSSRPLTQAEAVAFNRPEATGQPVYEPGGCVYCAGRGYSGRIGIFELLPCNEEISARIALRATEADVQALAKANGAAALRDDAAAKALAGLVTCREALKAIESF